MAGEPADSSPEDVLYQVVGLGIIGIAAAYASSGSEKVVILELGLTGLGPSATGEARHRFRLRPSQARDLAKVLFVTADELEPEPHTKARTQSGARVKGQG